MSTQTWREWPVFIAYRGYYCYNPQCIKHIEVSLMELRVSRITDSSQLEKITGWMYGWWGEAEGYALDAVRSYMAHSLNTRRLPQTYGLYLGDELIGMYQFTYEDLFARPDIYPWLANVYVDAQYRKKGYGDFLLRSVKENAEANLRERELFLFTSHIGLYEKYGWQQAGEIETFLEPHKQRLYRLELDK